LSIGQLHASLLPQLCYNPRHSIALQLLNG
jgi:hypothetical protein